MPRALKYSRQEYLSSRAAVESWQVNGAVADDVADAVAVAAGGHEVTPAK